LDDVAFDELAFLASSQAEGGVRDTIDVAQGSGGRFVEHGDGI
jgi:hypothetical protein